MNTVRIIVVLLSLIAYFDRPALAQAPTFSRLDTSLTLPLTGGVTVGDFDGDGFADVVLETHSTAEPFGLYFLHGQGDGTFAAPVLVFSGCCASVASGDFNGDGKRDLVFGADGEWVLPGNGDGTFGSVRRSPAPASPRPPLVVDLNGDGKLDLALAAQEGGVSVLLGNGDGTFAAAKNFPIGGGVEANAIVAGDFNGDGIPDIAASNPGAPDAFTGTTVSVLLGRGDGTFGAPTDFTVGTDPFPIATADFARNGRLDLAVANYQSASVSVLLGRGDGTFAPKIDAADGQFPVGLGAADFNGDGRPDIAVASGETSLAILLGNGDGTLGSVNSVAAVTSAENLAIADFNLDGKPDVFVVYVPLTNAFSVFINTTVADTTPPVVTASAGPSILWPPSGRSVPVTVSGTITDAGSGVDLASATFQVTDEYGVVHPSGTIAVNQDGSYRVRLRLTASREGADRNGRTYTITVSAKDKAGNVGSSKTTVRVPHDRGDVVERR